MIPGGRSGRGGWLLALGLLGCALGASACIGTETGNPPSATADPFATVLPPTEIGVDSPYYDADTLGGAAEMSSAYAWIDRVELIPEGACPSSLEELGAAFEGGQAIDLSGGARFDVPEGRYCAIVLHPGVAPTEPREDVPASLRGHSLAFQLRDVEGAPYVELFSRGTAPITLAPEGGVLVAPEGGLGLRLGLDAADALIANEFWDVATASRPDGSFVFNESVSPTFLRTFEQTPGLFVLSAESTGVPAGMDGGVGVQGLPPVASSI